MTAQEKEKELREALDAAREAVSDAIYCEDGLDGSTGEVVIKWACDILGDGDDWYKRHSEPEPKPSKTESEFAKKLRELRIDRFKEEAKEYGFIIMPIQPPASRLDSERQALREKIAKAIYDWGYREGWFKGGNKVWNFIDDGEPEKDGCRDVADSILDLTDKQKEGEIKELKIRIDVLNATISGLRNTLDVLTGNYKQLQSKHKADLQEILRNIATLTKAGQSGQFIVGFIEATIQQALKASVEGQK